MAVTVSVVWGASLMWFMDLVFEYAELKAEYFNQAYADILNDSLLALVVAAFGLFARIIILLIKDPKGMFKKKFTNRA